MVISGCADRFWQYNACGVDCLPCSLKIASPCDFFDEDGSQALAAELLVDGEEVDFGCVEDLLSDTQRDRNGGDKGHELMRRGCTDADVPFWCPAWRHESPGGVREGSPALGEQLTISRMQLSS